MPAFLTLLAAVSAQGQCLQILYLPDGTVEETMVADESSLETRSASAQAHSKGRSNSSASSSVSVSSSSNGKATSSSSSSAGNERRSVKVIRDEEGCKIIIDERSHPGEER